MRALDCRASAKWGVADSRRRSALEILEDQRGVCASETEAVGHDCIEADAVASLTDDALSFCGRAQLLDVGGRADEIVLHHQQRVDRLLDAGRSEGVAGR